MSCMFSDSRSTKAHYVCILEHSAEMDPRSRSLFPYYDGCVLSV